MKSVFSSNSETIHIYAQQNHPEGRSTGGNVFFYGSKLYSYGYHYLLAEFIDPNTVVINDKGYSNSTSKHINIAQSALSQYKIFYTTRTDLEYVASEVRYNLKKLAKARKPEIYINNILSLWRSLNEFIDYRGLKVKRSKDYLEIKRAVEAIEDSPENYKEKLQKLAKEKEAKAKRKAKKELKEKLQKFLNYKIHSFRVNGMNDFLRVSKDGESVETSQGVRVPIKEAKILYRLIKAGKDIKGFKISHYTVISINGVLKIGCHDIDTDSVQKVGEAII